MAFVGQDAITAVPTDTAHELTKSTPMTKRLGAAAWRRRAEIMLVTPTVSAGPDKDVALDGGDQADRGSESSPLDEGNGIDPDWGQPTRNADCHPCESNGWMDKRREPALSDRNGFFMGMANPPSTTERNALEGGFMNDSEARYAGNTVT